MESGPGHVQWAALYSQHKDAMWNAAARELVWVGMGHLAEDAVSEAMMSLLKFSPPDGVRDWAAFMANCARRRAQDLRRSATGKARVDTAYSARDTRQENQDFVDDLVETIDRRPLAAKGWAKLEMLGERERFALVQFKLNGRPQDDVAKDLGVSRARVSQLATAALKKLATMLEEEGVRW